MTFSSTSVGQMIVAVLRDLSLTDLDMVNKPKFKVTEVKDGSFQGRRLKQVHMPNLISSHPVREYASFTKRQTCNYHFQEQLFG